MLSLRRLDPSRPEDLATFASAFRGAPSFVHATEGRVPTDDDIRRMMNTVPRGRTASDMFVFAVEVAGDVRGCAFLARDFPRPGTAYLVLLLLIESAQGRGLGREVVGALEAMARSWGCSRMEALADSANPRALRFWLREGYEERLRTSAPGLVGQAIALAKNMP